MSDLDLVFPGKTLDDELIARNILPSQFAKRISVTPIRIAEIIKGVRRITPETALRIGRAFDMNPLFWLNLQSHYDIELARLKYGAQVEKDVVPFLKPKSKKT